METYGHVKSVYDERWINLKTSNFGNAEGASQNSLQITTNYLWSDQKLNLPVDIQFEFVLEK